MIALLLVFFAGIGVGLTIGYNKGYEQGYDAARHIQLNQLTDLRRGINIADKLMSEEQHDEFLALWGRQTTLMRLRRNTIDLDERIQDEP